ncbi:hypothetical protein DL89DRAFT_73020 [Linderina pennispora]|uniref:Uncharacterized protein n=1 Tax=Linderina pennispora TaxID=61395 RepID=A0A1Y1VYT6_9FUNG|nr:uncharacterized protein DL89DRAFT_73020 [Linderina pennispora]ORX66185.1 hypothetical protein DL89DRAFT_73020 [Linderina pennispora]
MADDSFDLEDTKALVNLGRTGVYLSAIEGDVRTLMRTFQKLQAYDFESFCAVWKVLNFSLIHFVATEKNSRQNFMRTVYRIVLNHLQQGALLEIRIGVVYALYLLYYSQPVNFPNIKVRVSMEHWAVLTSLYQYCRGSEIHDIVYIFDKLREDAAFELVAWIDEHEGILRLESDEGVGGRVATRLAQIEHEVMGSAQGNIGDPAAAKRQLKLAEEYRNVKRRIINSRLAERAAQDMYIMDFGVQREDIQGMPVGVPLDISGQDIGWWAETQKRVKGYQRIRAERVGALAEDDGSLRVMEECPDDISGLDGAPSRRAVLSKSDYDTEARHYKPDHLRAIERATKAQHNPNF